MEKSEALSELFSISEQPEKNVTFTTILYNKSTKETEDGNNVQLKPRFNRFCFNCGNDDHNVRDCPKPHNQNRIAQNRIQFSRGHNSKGLEFTRYHKEIDDRFTGFRPGILSNKLREALGLKQDKLPRHIYNMRLFGYPPGWLEEAKISHSGINMIDSNGERIPDPDEEEGEICSVRVKYDVNKIIDYPGFNVWPNPGTINETELYRSVPLCYDQCKTAFVGRLNDSNFSNDYLAEAPTEKPTNRSREYDMDIEELDIHVKFDSDENTKFGFIPPLPTEQPPQPPLPPSDDEPLSTVEEEEANSEEEEGELPRKVAVRRGKVTRTTSSEDSGTLRRSSSPEHVPDEQTAVTLDHADEESPTTSYDVAQSSNTENYETLISPQDGSGTLGRIKSIELGTPVLNHSPYRVLPSPDKFRKDISDVIYFENLPNSTGKYERLKSVLKSVRSKLTTIRGSDTKKSS